MRFRYLKQALEKVYTPKILIFHSVIPTEIFDYLSILLHAVPIQYYIHL